jgi:HPt (histidine-containing phosphotransfer) domain-containing protein
VTLLAESTAPLYSTSIDDPDVADLIDDYVATMPQTIATMESAVAERDWSHLLRQSHRLRGSAAGYGFTTIGAAAGALELAIFHGNTGAILNRFNSLLSLCRRVRSRRSAHAG